MKTSKNMIAVIGTAVCAVGLVSSEAVAGSHTWRINEIYSNADGSVQFIELIETCGGSGETFLSGHQTKSNANAVNMVNLPPNSSADKFLLFGTANLTSFGGPTPDYIIPANFFSLTGDVLQYTPYHSCNVASGSIPTNGTNSLNRAAGCATSTCPATSTLNSPTNFNGESSPVNAGGCMDGDGDGYGSPGDASCPNGPETDCNNANPAINPGANEVCNDSTDNDCDGDTDCTDSDCAAACVPTVSEVGMAICAVAFLAVGATLVNKRRPEAPTA